MKKILKKLILMLILAFSIGAVCTACDPDTVDAFADGYRDGYYGNY